MFFEMTYHFFLYFYDIPNYIEESVKKKSNFHEF